MRDKKHKSVEHQLLEKELMHSGKYGHKVTISKKSYNRNKVKKELLKELQDGTDETTI